MSDGTQISWTDATWNPVVGCDKVSSGCDNCYAIRTARRMSANPNPKVSAAYAGTEAGGEWTGQVNLLEDRLDQPLRWQKPRRIFVNAQSDLFHKEVPNEFIARVFAVMALAPQHTFQILTKRPGRMRSLLNSPGWPGLVAFYMGQSVLVQKGDRLEFDTRCRPEPALALLETGQPLPNVWLGVSVEDQKTAELRIPLLLDTPAAVRWLSCEPLLGALNLAHMDVERHSTSMYFINALTGRNRDMGRPCAGVPSIDWVVVGGESGPNARPMHPDWARSLRDQCVAAEVPFHFKQWGEWQGGSRVGKRAAGRLLDGRTWDEYPTTEEKP